MLKQRSKINSINELADLLPKHSYARSGKPMEPINLVVIGNKRFLFSHFKKHGWYRADKIGAVSLSKALVAAVFDRSYKRGPIAGSYIAGHHFTLAFEKPTRADTFRHRHHLRLWRTPYKIRGRRVWAGTISYDRAAGAHQGLLPTHHIAPTLNWEENFLAESFGINRPRHLTLDQPYKGQLNNGDTYEYDGKALVLDLSGLEL